MKYRLLSLSLAFAFLLGSPGWAAQTRTENPPSILEQVLSRTSHAAEEGLRPIVIFDLDDTLINTRNRNQRILHHFSREAEVLKEYPAEAKILAHVPLTKIHYELADTLKALGIESKELITQAQQYWEPRFFSNAYAAQDAEVSGGRDYVFEIHKRGAFVVYLTGRDIPRMEMGTRQNLHALGFPMDSHTQLLMKPKKEQDDLSFKKEAFEWISQQGTVIAGFENEPANVNAFQARWPEGTMVFLDTIHSKKPVVPDPGIPWIKDFRY